MNIVNKRKKSPKEDEALSKQTKKIEKKQKKIKKSNLVQSIICILISAGLFAYVYFVLLKEHNLILFSENSSPFFAGKQFDVNRKWASLRSGHYFGLKTFAEQSIVFGLMWFENRIIDNNVRIRHWCDQSDSLTKYGWLKHDFHSFGVQEILDNDLNLTTSFLLSRTANWRARIQIDFNEAIKNQLKQSANSTKARINKELSLIPYFALDSLAGDNEQLAIERDLNQISQFKSAFIINGKTKVFQNGFKAKIIVENKYLIYSNALNSTIDPPLLEIKENVMENLFLTDFPGEEMNKDKYLIILRDNLKKKKDQKKQKTNLALQQIIVKVPSTIEIEFEELIDSAVEKIDYATELSRKEAEFDEKFENLFKLNAKGYLEDEIKFAKSALANMIGSIGVFNGFSLVSLIEDNKLIKKENRKIYKYGPLNLLTSVPSRSFFPRGFLWDDGFHQLLISKFDRNLSKAIISSWFSLMNRNGWIPREVILGDEAESRVPEEFIVQNVHVANPPTLFLAIDSLLNNLPSSNGDADRDYFQQLFGKLVVRYNWFNRTQNGFKAGSYRWKGRNAAIKTELNVKTLSSGLDDYPRASSPTDEELHLDLFSWMTYATGVMKRLAQYLNHSSYERFNSHYSWLISLLDELHWSEEHQAYCDIGLHSKKVILKPIRSANNQLIKIRKELEPPSYGCVNEFGYVSLFPFILQLLEPTSVRLNVILNKLKDPNLLWSNYGLRSLSKNSSYYNVKNTEHDPPYWRSAIWLNINYLTLKSLHYYSNQDGAFKAKAKVIYDELKSNLINSVFNQYKDRNYLFENYDDQSGSGKGCYPFSGWTSLIVLIMSDNYQ